MKKIITVLILLLFAALLATVTSCSNSQPAQPSSPSPAAVASPTAATAAGSPSGVASGRGLSKRDGSISADSNPIRVCDGSNLGVTELNWKATGIAPLEVHLNAPNGPLFARTGNIGKGRTGKWVTDGAAVYLQDVTDGVPLDANNTIAILVLKLTTAGCP